MKRIRKWLKWFGPGFTAGSADDDPSGIATYSIAGAQFGYNLNWMSLFLIPMMISIQEMCARLGMVTGRGLAGIIKKHYSKKVLYFAVTLLVIANIINIGADLGIMAQCLNLLFPTNFYFWLFVIVITTLYLEIKVSYSTYAKYLKWFGLILIAYVITALLSKQNWGEVIKATAMPQIQLNKMYLMAMVGFLGTTISPYLFFWQADQEVEEEIENKIIEGFGSKPTLKRNGLKFMRRDTIIGMVYSNLIAMFVVLTTASTLFKNGIFAISSPIEASLALKPLAGNFAFLLFSVGIIGIGLQAIPVLAGGVAYVVSETFGWKEGLYNSFNRAKKFYVTLIIAVVIGALINLIGVNPMHALYYSAIINGVVSAPLIFLIIKLSSDKKVVGEEVTPKISKIIAYFTLFFIALSSLSMLLFMII